MRCSPCLSAGPVEASHTVLMPAAALCTPCAQVGFLLVMTAAMLAGLRWTITQVLLHGHKAHGERGEQREAGLSPWQLAVSVWVGVCSPPHTHAKQLPAACLCACAGAGSPTDVIFQLTPIMGITLLILSLSHERLWRTLPGEAQGRPSLLVAWFPEDATIPSE